MFERPSEVLERHRITTGRFGSNAKYGNNGFFIVPGPQLQKLLCVVSDNTEWMPVTGFEDLYRISNTGQVMALAKDVHLPNGAKRHHDEAFLSQEIMDKGYRRVSLNRDGKMTKVMVHRLVAEAFIANPSNYPIVNHIDGNPSNNIVSNLEWCTHTYNIHHAIERGMHQGKNMAEIDEIAKIFAQGMTLEEVAEKIGLTPNGAKHYRNGYIRQAPIDMPSRYPQEHLWEHVSVSLMNKKRLPTWEEMCFVKGLFWSEDECVVQYHPPKSDYVNFSEALHLWKPVGIEMSRPPHWMVGPKGVEEGLDLMASFLGKKVQP